MIGKDSRVNIHLLKTRIGDMIDNYIVDCFIIIQSKITLRQLHYIIIHSKIKLRQLHYIVILYTIK